MRFSVARQKQANVRTDIAQAWKTVVQVYDNHGLICKFESMDRASPRVMTSVGNLLFVTVRLHQPQPDGVPNRTRTRISDVPGR